MRRPIVFGLVALLAGCRAGPQYPVSRTWTAMGTYASLAVGPGSPGLERCADITLKAFETVEARASTYRPASDITRLNQAAGKVVPVDAVTRELLEAARDYAERSGGAFDISVAPLMKLWGFRDGKPPTALPGGKALEAALARVDWRSVELRPEGARLALAGASVDLGGIAKGYAVDAAFDRLVPLGATNLLVNLGGNMRAAGQAEQGRVWRVGVRDPFAREGLLGQLELSGGMALATSGNYEKFVTLDGTRYAHIMDPRTGRPVSGMAGVTVLAPSAVEADAMSTALFVAGLDAAPTMLARVPGCEALIVPDRRPLELWATPGFRSRFTPRKDLRKALRTLGNPSDGKVSRP